jgi:hypothetical protein
LDKCGVILLDKEFLACFFKVTIDETETIGMFKKAIFTYCVKKCF